MAHPLRDGVVVKAAVALIAPLGIVRLAGSCRFLLLDVRFTVAVEEVAARVTVHVPEAPGTTLLGAQVRVERIGAAAVSDSAKVLDVPLREAVMEIGRAHV